MAKKGGAPENLDPVRTKEEAKARGRNGGIKSGEARRAKRDARQAMKLLLDMAAKGNLDENLKRLGITNSEDMTNLMALQARVFTMAMGGDLRAYDRVMKIAGYDPDDIRRDKEEERKERESLERAANQKEELQIRRMVAEERIRMGEFFDDPTAEDEIEDVVIYMPYTERDEGLEIPREKMK